MTATRRTHLERQRDAEDRLTQSLAELIAAQGYERTTAAQIGERAGYSRAAVRDRYGSKEGLLLALHERYERALVGDDPATVTEFFARLADYARLHPEWLRAIFIVSFEAVGASDAFAPVVRRWIVTLQDTALRLLQIEQAAGRIRSDVNLNTYVPGAIDAMIGGAFRWCLTGDLHDGQAMIQSRAAELLADLQPPPSDTTGGEPRGGSTPPHRVP
jgi:AcrR family transcriptional regulator